MTPIMLEMYIAMTAIVPRMIARGMVLVGFSTMPAGTVATSSPMKHHMAEARPVLYAGMLNVA